MSIDTNEKEKLRILAPDLPFLASEAAVDLDNLISGYSEDLIAIHKLALRLKNSLGNGSNVSTTSQARFLTDPATSSILKGVITETFPSGVDNIFPHINEITKYLANCKDATIDNLKMARDFCVALSRRATEYQKSIYELQPLHPYRK